MSPHMSSLSRQAADADSAWQLLSAPILQPCSLVGHSAVQAFILYEESIPDSRQEVRALQSIMGTLNRQVVAAWHSMVCVCVWGGGGS